MENMGFIWDLHGILYGILYGIYMGIYMGSILLIFHYHVDSLTYDFQWKRRVG
jgi:hypothetical protein